MSASSIRIEADAERLRALVLASDGHISLLQEPTPSALRFLLDLRYATAGSSAYPTTRQSVVRLAIDLPARYPFQPPVATIRSPIFHPNVFSSGLVCQGTKWLPSEGLDLFVRRIAKLVTFDPLFVNTQSAANHEALRWYVRALRASPAAFPSDRVEIAMPEESKPKVTWQSTPAERVVRECPRCTAKLRLPSGRSGEVRCPSCGGAFSAVT